MIYGGLQSVQTLNVLGFKGFLEEEENDTLFKWELVNIMNLCYFAKPCILFYILCLSIGLFINYLVNQVLLFRHAAV